MSVVVILMRDGFAWYFGFSQNCANNNKNSSKSTYTAKKNCSTNHSSQNDTKICLLGESFDCKDATIFNPLSYTKLNLVLMYTFVCINFDFFFHFAISELRENVIQKLF